VTEGAPAAAAGLRARDAVVAVDGRPLEGADALVAQIRALRPGTEVTLTVVRDGASRDVTVTLAARPTEGG
jgi:putative serine protease PepD